MTVRDQLAAGVPLLSRERQRFTGCAPVSSPRRLSLTAILVLGMGIVAAPAAFAGGPGSPAAVDMTSHWAGFACIAIFIAAYALIAAEERLHLRKSIPVILAAGLIWLLVAVAFARHGSTEVAVAAVRQNLLDFAELFLFLLSAMTYVNTLDERNVFAALRVWLLHRGLSLRGLFWVTGLLAFVISPIADNLTTTLVMGAVTIAVGAGNPKFITVACINIVVAANAGGAFSPFGDITTLMVWQKGVVAIGEFVRLFLPSLVTWVVPAAIMALAIDRARPEPTAEQISLLPGARVVLVLFVGTISATVLFHGFLHMPPALGMMTGLGVLKLYSFVIQRSSARTMAGGSASVLMGLEGDADVVSSFDTFRILERIEWDTLMFFYGVVLCVGGLGTLGYLAHLSAGLYGGLGPIWANTLVGVLSAVVDNIPVMFAVLEMNPAMSHSQWLLVTLTAGVGGSLLSIGSAAGVALMGQARGVYTFASHLKWSWAIALGYAAGIAAHLLISGR